MQTLHSYYFCFKKSLFKPAKTSIGMFIQLLSKENETLQSYICNPSSRDGIIARDIVDLSRCIINGRYREVPLMGDNIVIEINKQTCNILPT